MAVIFNQKVKQLNRYLFCNKKYYHGGIDSNFIFITGIIEKSKRKIVF